MPLACVRMTPDTAPNCTQRLSSSGVRRRPPKAKKPPMSEPQVLIPDSPIVTPLVTADSSPSKPQPTVGSPPQTICAHGATPVKPERMNLPSGRRVRRANA